MSIEISVLDPISDLQHLSFAVATSENQSPAEPWNSTVLSLVQHLRILKSLQELTIFIQARYGGSWRDCLQLLSDSRVWEGIDSDSALRNRSSSSVLEKVCICVCTPRVPEPNALADAHSAPPTSSHPTGDPVHKD